MEEHSPFEPVKTYGEGPAGESAEQPEKETAMPEEQPVTKRSMPEEQPVTERFMPEEQPVTERFMPQEQPATERFMPEKPPVTESAEESIQTPDPLWTAPRSEWYHAPQTAPTQMTEGPLPPAQPARKPKKKRFGLWVAVCAICCGLLGSICGGAIVGFTMQQRMRQEENNGAVQAETQPTQPSAAAPLSSSSTTLMTPSQVYQANVNAVVGIANESTTMNVFGQVAATASSGTGFLISPDGEILTNYHVVEGANNLTVTLYDGREYEAEVLGYEAESDVALIKIDGSDLPTVTLGTSASLSVGDEIAAIGNPLGELTYSLTVGYLSAIERYINTDGTPINMMQIDAAINSGNSGGPLFDMYGNVVGITSAKYSGTTGSGATIEGIGFAIPIDDVKSILDDLRENGTVVNRAYIGVTVRNVTANEAENSGLPYGAYVDSVERDSGGWNAGLRSGDVITAVDGRKITSFSDLSVRLKNYRGGDTAELAVYRDGKTLTLTVVFGEKPEEETVVETVPEETFNPWSFLFP